MIRAAFLLAASPAMVVSGLGQQVVRPLVGGALNATAKTCVAHLGSGEKLAIEAEKPHYGCIGGIGGYPFEGHVIGQTVKSFTLWPTGASDEGGSVSGGATGLSWVLTSGQEFTKGHPRGNSCSFTFSPGDHIVGDVGMHGNGQGKRFGRIEFNVRRGATGKIESFGCGTKHTRYSFPADGMVIAGFVGSSAWDIDNLGIIIVKPDCAVVSREIVDMECVTPIDGDKMKCASAWADAGTTDTAHAICDFCNSSNDGTCGAQFTMTESHSISTTSSMSDEIGGSASLATEVSMEFLGEGGKMTDTYTVSYSHTWSSSKEQTHTTTSAIQSTCSVDMKAHTRTIFDSIAHIGHMTADIKLTVRSKDHCGGSDDKTYDGKVTISNVPITAMISECSPRDDRCRNDQKRFLV